MANRAESRGSLSECDPTPFFGCIKSEQDTAPGYLSVQETAAQPMSSKVNSASHPLSYAEQCAALALYHQTVARYLADIEAVEGDPCFWTAMGERHAEGAVG
jgi:hypothetical protein